METAKLKAANKVGRPDKESLACKARGREATMGRLISAATSVFSTHGYDAATTKLVATEAGINESLINRYFDGKAGLLLALIKTYISGEREEGPWSKYPEGKTVEEDLRNYFRTTVKHFSDRQALIKIFVSRALVDEKVREEVRSVKRDGAPASLIEHLSGLQKRGLIRKDADIKRVAAVVDNVCFATGFIDQAIMGKDTKSIEATLTTFARDYARGLSPHKLAP